jgi:hypothetical protein
MGYHPSSIASENRSRRLHQMAKFASKRSTSKTNASSNGSVTQSNGTIQAVDLPVGVAARVAESVQPLVELRNREALEPRIQRIREQIASELKQSERRGAELRREAVQRVQPLRDRVGEQVGWVRERIAALR